MAAAVRDTQPYSTGISYPLPISIKEFHRLEEQVICLADLMGRTTHAPIPPKPSILLDIGCGTGAVTCYLGHAHPTAHVYGIDLSPVPNFHPKPPNVTYIQGDAHDISVLDPRLVPGTADLAFARLLICGIRDWLACISDMRDMMKPGAWIESQELNASVFDSSGRNIDDEMEWVRVMRQAMAMVENGLDPDAGSNVKRCMEEAGLVDVQSHVFRRPVGTWLADEEPGTKRVGEYDGKEMWTPMAVVLDELAVGKGRYGIDEVEELKRQMRRDMKPKVKGEKGVHFVFTVTLDLVTKQETITNDRPNYTPHVNSQSTPHPNPTLPPSLPTYPHNPTYATLSSLNHQTTPNATTLHPSARPDPTRNPNK
ncbi:S-adenosyl-L-methionine-dependent methyltransferase [Aspergillus ellipticus CBS 707.79]|uniref:S-adenosyl-L-methionine-dependent methyltransferase n=1 Tax=Aspergillus ellipticus CBS 707.79 TaxID=1448320 RepID=A0A319DIF5_9EURO|nr:S-adenosyl-L-methionine-dependent methyltransferase [Aspergillus ellipticus CBS 707.79]